MDNTMIPRQEEQLNNGPERPQRRESRSRLTMAAAALVCSAAALVLSVTALWMTWPDPQPQPEPEAVPAMARTQPEGVEYLTYRGHQLPIDTEAGENDRPPSGFRRSERGWVTYENEGVTALQGVDVSAHQGEIDWQQVAQSGIEFAVIRAGYRGYGEQGSLKSDEYFHKNMAGALDAGLEVGVYFFSQATNVWEAEEEARMLLEAVEGYEITLPLIFDWERIYNAPSRTSGVRGKSVTLMAETFCAAVEQAGYEAGVYFNKDLAYLDLELGRLKDRTFWLAEYGESPDFRYRFDIWQYTCTGSVPGIEGDVDMNLYFKEE